MDTILNLIPIYRRSNCILRVVVEDGNIGSNQIRYSHNENRAQSRILPTVRTELIIGNRRCQNRT